MISVKPQVFHIGQTALDPVGTQQYLNAVGAREWTTNAATGAEALIEVMGRTCYRSFAPGLNKNVTKVREGNAPYLQNIIKAHHGSVVEHATDSYILFNVSRAVTHQVVRARVGVAYSQESLHYVRVDTMGANFPQVFEDHPQRDEIFELWISKIESLEAAQLELARLVDIDNQPFEMKKKLSTAMRRLVPIGFATVLGITANHRTWRWMTEQRTERHNDEEIRYVFAEIFRQQRDRYPALYFDAVTANVEGILEVKFANSKI